MCKVPPRHARKVLCSKGSSQQSEKAKGSSSVILVERTTHPSQDGSQKAWPAKAHDHVASVVLLMLQ